MVSDEPDAICLLQKVKLDLNTKPKCEIKKYKNQYQTDTKKM